MQKCARACRCPLTIVIGKVTQQLLQFSVQCIRWGLWGLWEEPAHPSKPPPRCTRNGVNVVCVCVNVNVRLCDFYKTRRACRPRGDSLTDV
jgi:hypothetical protein